jgi:hypothetical protein
MQVRRPRYMRSFYLWIRVSAIANWPFLWSVSPNLQSFLVFLNANPLYASQFFWSLSIAYNEVQLYKKAEHNLSYEKAVRKMLVKLAQAEQI